MPELPDILAYIEALGPRVIGEPLNRIRVATPFLLRTADPPLATVEGRLVRELRHVGKRIAFGLEDDLWLVLHLMIAGRLHWRPANAKLSGRQNLASLDFPRGSLVLTEAGTRHRAALHLVRGEESLRSFNPGGIDVFAADVSTFRAALTAANHTLKRALTDPRIVIGIGNAYSDEILHAAQLSPIAQTQKVKPEEWERLSRRQEQRWDSGLSAFVQKRASVSPRKSRLFGRAWLCMGGMASRVRSAARRSCASAMPTTRPTTAHAAKLAERCSPIAGCPGSWGQIGHAAWKNLKACRSARLRPALLKFEAPVLFLARAIVGLQIA